MGARRCRAFPRAGPARRPDSGAARSWTRSRSRSCTRSWGSSRTRTDGGTCWCGGRASGRTDGRWRRRVSAVRPVFCFRFSPGGSAAPFPFRVQTTTRRRRGKRGPRGGGALAAAGKGPGIRDRGLLPRGPRGLPGAWKLIPACKNPVLAEHVTGCVGSCGSLLAVVRSPSSDVSSSGPLFPRRTLEGWRESRERQRSWERVWSASLMRSESPQAHLGEKEAQGGPCISSQFSDKRLQPGGPCSSANQ